MDQLREDVQEALEKVKEKLITNENLKHEDVEALLIFNLMKEEG